MLDHGEADDKVLAILDSDPLWSEVGSAAELPQPLVERLTHYFATYKTLPGEQTEITIGPPYGREHAEAVVRAAIEDYLDEYVR